MKPKTRIQCEVLALSSELPQISDAATRWAKSRPFRNIGLMRRAPHSTEDGVVRCQCCGNVHLLTDGVKRLGRVNFSRCPKCGVELYLSQVAKLSKTTDAALCTIVQSYKGWQVFRTIQAERENDVSKDTEYRIIEVFQNWIAEDGKEVVVGHGCARGFNYFHWKFDEPMSIRQHNGGCNGAYVYDDVYSVYGNYLYPRMSFTQILRRNGISATLMRSRDADPLSLTKRLLTDPFVEELVKCGQHAVLLHWLNSGGMIADRTSWQHAIRICVRNGYVVRDAGLWFDLLDACRILGLDTHSPKYVCPSNIGKMHDRMMACIAKAREKGELEEKRKELSVLENGYKKRMCKYFGLSYSGNGIIIEPLRSVNEFMEEGEAMHHCVCDMGYYDAKRHPNSLILSAREADSGERIETIEVNTKNWYVVQSRGVCNGDSPRHVEILQMMEDFMPQIRAAAITG